MIEKKWKFVIQYYFNASSLTSLLAVRKIFQRPINDFIAVDLFFCFLMYIVSVTKPTFMMILNQMIDLLWQTAVAVLNSTTRRAWTFKIKFFEMGNTTYNGNVFLSEISYLNYITYIIKTRGLSVEALCGEIWHKASTDKPLFSLHKLYNSDNLFLQTKHFHCMWYFPSQKTSTWMFMLFLWRCSTQPLQFATKYPSSDLISSWK